MEQIAFFGKSKQYCPDCKLCKSSRDAWRVAFLLTNTGNEVKIHAGAFMLILVIERVCHAEHNSFCYNFLDQRWMWKVDRKRDIYDNCEELCFEITRMGLPYILAYDFKTYIASIVHHRRYLNKINVYTVMYAVDLAILSGNDTTSLYQCFFSQLQNCTFTRIHGQQN